MIPWERDIYVALLQQHLEEEKLKHQQANGIQDYYRSTRNTLRMGVDLDNLSEEEDYLSALKRVQLFSFKRRVRVMKDLPSFSKKQ